MRYVYMLLILLPKAVFAWVDDDVREEGGGGGSITGLLAAILGVIAGYPILFTCYFVQCLARCKNPVVQNAISMMNDNIRTYTETFLCHYIFAMPFLFFPALLFVKSVTDLNMAELSIYVSYTVLCLFTATGTTLFRKT